MLNRSLVVSCVTLVCVALVHVPHVCVALACVALVCVPHVRLALTSSCVLCLLSQSLQIVSKYMKNNATQWKGSTQISHSRCFLVLICLVLLLPTCPPHAHVFNVAHERFILFPPPNENNLYLLIAVPDPWVTLNKILQGREIFLSPAWGGGLHWGSTGS